MPAKSKTNPDSKQLKVGDEVEWTSSGGKSVGRIEKKITGTARVKGHVAKATASKPEFQVRSEKSGKVAIHKPSGLRRKSGSSK